MSRRCPISVVGMLAQVSGVRFQVSGLEPKCENDNWNGFDCLRCLIYWHPCQPVH